MPTLRDLEELRARASEAQAAGPTLADLEALRASSEAPPPMASTRQRTGSGVIPIDVRDMGTTERIGRAALGGIEDMGLGLRQMSNFVPEALGVPGAREQGLEMEQAAREMADRKRMLYDTTAGTVGQVLPALAVPGATIPRAVAGGLAYGAAQPQEQEGERLKESLQSGAAMGLGNAVVRGVVGAGKKVLAPNLGKVKGTEGEKARASTRLKGMDELEAQGFKVSAGQRSGNRMVRGLESVFPELITTSGRAQSRDAANKVNLNQLVAKSFGQGAAVKKTGVIDDEVISSAAAKLGQKIQTALPEDHVIPPTQAMISGLADVQAKAAKGLKSQQSAPLKDALSDLHAKMFSSGEAGVTKTAGVTGEDYGVIKSQLTKLRRDLFKTNDRKAAMLVGDMENLLDDAADESLRATPEALKIWRKARKQWGGMRVAEESIDEAGDVMPKALKAAIKRNRPKDLVARKGRKRSDLGQLSKNIGALKEVVGDSGTAIRTGSRQLLTGIGQGGLGIYGASEASEGNFLPGLAAILGPVGAQRLLTSPAFAKYLTKTAPEGGALGTTIAELMRRGAGAGAYGTLQELYQ